ncbi:MAG: hypothetical protein OXJ54_06285 [Gemmatimonadetes bacterium]|nr:hypothetical protein [Candidatus Palauibacter rhopaloidicola]
MKRPGATFIAIVAFLAGMQPLTAQSPGDRVRVTTDRGSRLIGQIVEVTEDRFDLSLRGGQSVSVPRGEILRFERSRGRSSRAGLVALGGAVSGAAFGALLSCIFECTDETPLAAAGGALAGGVVGLGLGALIRGPERWEIVSVDGGASPEPVFTPIIDLRVDHGRPAAVLGARLRI